MKNIAKKLTILILAVCMVTTNSSNQASASAYKKSISKKVQVNPDSDSFSDGDVYFELKEKATIIVTVKAADGRHDEFSFGHPSLCHSMTGCTKRPYIGEGKNKVTVKFKLPKGKHVISVFPDYLEEIRDFKLTIKVKNGKAILKSLKKIS